MGGEVHKFTDAGTVSLEGAQDRPDGHNRDGEQGAFMAYLNDDMTEVDPAELRAASRLIQWACRNPGHRRAQVALAVQSAREKLERAAKKVSQKGATLEGCPVPECAMVMDILHQGRGTYSRIAKALNAGDPMAALCQIGRPTYAARIDEVSKHAKALLGKGVFGKLKYSVSQKDFVS